MSQAVLARSVRAVGGGVILWLSGLGVGTLVFAMPRLAATPPIPHVSSHPWITGPVVLLWSFLAWLLARRGVASASHPAAEGLRTGLTFAAVNVLLDLLVVVGLMGNGLRFYGFLGPWLAYLVLVIVPWWTGRAAMRSATNDG
jgi:hypothetical protein